MLTPQRKQRETATASAIVTEVLSAVFVPIHLRKILREACESAGIASVPETPNALREFIEGALFSTLVRHLGVATSLELDEQVRSSLAHVLGTHADYANVLKTREVPSSNVRDGERQGETATGRRVLVVTQASLVVFLLQDIFGDAVDVLPVSCESELKDRLRRFGSHPLVVVIDRRHPCVGPGVARVLRTDLSKDSGVVWWGANAEELLDVEDMLIGGPTLTWTSHDLPLAELGEVCRSVVDRFWE